MEYKFAHSLVMGQLAREAARTPPSEKDSPFAYVDRSLTIVGRTFHTHGEQMRQEFLGQREFITNQNKEIEKKMDGRFQEVEKKMDGRFQEVEKKMDGRFQEVEKKMDKMEKKMDGRFQHILKASWNFLRIRGWEEIHPVGTFDARGEYHIPEYFPRTVKRFWSLKDPSQMDRLIHLIRFYNVQGYEEWGMDADSFEGCSDSDESTINSSESSRLPIPLEWAVRSHPVIAHRALAAQLGLAYDEIQGFMERAQELRHARAKEHNKRGHDEQTFHGKRRRSSKLPPEEEGTEVTSPTEPLSSQGRSRQCNLCTVR